jgi:hypothetical protein
MQAIAHVFSSLLSRYRRQVSDLDAADNQDDIDQLVEASQETLTDLLGTRPHTAAGLADKIDALIERYADFGTVPMDHVRQLLLDAHHLATEPGMTLAWVHLWHDLGCTLMVRPDGSRHLALPDPLRIGNQYTSQLSPNLVLKGEDEANGAAKTLQALIRLAGERAAKGVFAFADIGREG